MSINVLREQVLYLLQGGAAHLHFDQAVEGLPSEMRAAKIDGVPHTMWRLLEHMRICQWDILDFCRNSQHVSPEFPDGYWPDGDAPPNDNAWDQSLRTFRADQQAMIDLISDPGTDLLAPISHASGQTILREALLLADHNAYHLGQMVFLRRCLGVWED